MQQLNCTVFKFLLLGFIFVLPQASKAQSQIFKGNNTTALDQGSSWVGGVVPTSGNVIVYNNTNSSSSTAPVGAGLSVAGIFFSTNPSANITINAGTGALSLGASGIDIRASTSRTLTIAAPINLTADQTWYTGLANANTVMITANGAISGAGKLTIGGAVNSSNQFVLLNGANTFSGGLTLNDGGAVRGGSTGAAVSGTSVTASSYGTGPLTINGGTIFGNSGQVGASTITINGDFRVNKGAAGGVNGRLTLGGGFDLGGQTRTITVGGYNNVLSGANGVLTSGRESLRFMPISATVGPSNTVANGTIRLVRDTAGADGADFVAVNFSSGKTIFATNAGLTVGKGVITTLATSFAFGNASNSLPQVNVESGGYFNLADSANARTPFIRALSGDGVVTALAVVAGTNSRTSLLTLQTQLGDQTVFSGAIQDGDKSQLASLVPGVNNIMALTKNGLGTQVLSGSNNFSGNTSITEGELRFSKRTSLYAGNTALWTNLSVNSGATLGLSLGGSDGFASPDLDIFVNNPNILKAGSKLGLDVASSNGPVTLSTVLSNSANPNGITFSKSGNGQLDLSGYTGTYTNPVTISGGTLKFTQLSTYSGTPAITGGGVLDLGGASFPIPNSVTLTSGSMVNFTPGVSDPFAPASNPSYTGFSFAVNNLNGNGRTFYLTNSTLTVNGNVETNAFNVTGASNGIMRLTGQTLGQGDTIAPKGQINVQDSVNLEFASNSVFDSYRVLAMSSANPKLLVSGGTVSNLNYVMLGAGLTNRGTLEITSGSLAVLNPNPSQNGFYFGQNGGTGNFNLEGGSASTTVLKVQSGTANINISGGALNLVATNAATNPASGWSLSGNGTVNFTMSGGSVNAPNSKFNLSSGNSTNNIITNVSYLHSGGTISSVEMSAGAGTFTMDGGTNESAGMFVGDNPNGAVLFTQNNGLVRIKGEAGSQAANDLVIGSANGNGTYVLNGGVLEVFGKIRKNSGTSSLILNGGAIRYTNSTNQTAFISSLVDTTVGTGGAIFEITDSNVTNSIQATLNDVSGQVGKLVKRGAGTLAIGRGNLGYSGSTKVEDGTLSVTDTNAGYVARISRDQVIMEFASAPAGPTSTFPILPSSLEDGTSRISANGLAANQQISFDPSTSIATVVTAAGPTDPYELWAQGSPLTSETLLRYALGGASSPTSDDAQPTTVRRSGNDLVLSVVVRANDLTLTYQPQTSDDLSPDSWMNTNAPYTLPVSQGVPENFERREYSVPATNPRLFLRIQVTK